MNGRADAEPEEESKKLPVFLKFTLTVHRTPCSFGIFVWCNYLAGADKIPHLLGYDTVFESRPGNASSKRV